MTVAKVQVQQRRDMLTKDWVTVGKIEQTAHDTYAWTYAGFRCLRSSIEDAKEAAKKDFPDCRFN